MATKKVPVNLWWKYNKLTILSEISGYTFPCWDHKRRVLCKCECGKTTEALLNNIIKWTTKSCWCFRREKMTKKQTSHGFAFSRIYKIWTDMKKRCSNVNVKHYDNYWWRWINYTDKWETFEWFYIDMREWYNENLTLERIDVNSNYCKENCKWIPRKLQSRNKRNSIIYKWKCLIEWCEELNLSYSMVNQRINKLWWNIEKALNINN